MTKVPLEEYYKEHPHTKVIFDEMCRSVGADASKVRPDTEEWFMEYSWTMAQEQEFKAWLIDYLKKNKGARNEIMARPSTNKKMIDGVASMFLFTFGWKIKDE